MSGTSALVAIFVLGVAAGYMLRGAMRFSMTADEVAWGWGFKRRHRRWWRRFKGRSGGAPLPAAAGAAGAGGAYPDQQRPALARRAMALVSTGLIAAAFVGGYVLVGGQPQPLSLLLEQVPLLSQLVFWSRL